MATALGLETVLGTGVETTFGTPVVPDRFHEFLSESLRYQHTVRQSAGIRAGASNRLARGSRRERTRQWGDGDLSMEVATKGMGRLFQQMLGGTSTIAQIGVTTAYRQTHQLGSVAGKSLTIQKGLRDNAGGLVGAFTFSGCKIATWELSIATDGTLELSCGIDAQKVATDVALAAFSYPATGVFGFEGGSILVDNVAVANVSDASISGDNQLRTDAFFLGTNGLKGEQHVNDRRAVTGSLTAEFRDLTTFYDRYTGDVPAKLVLDFLGDVIAGTERERVTITVPDVRFTGDPPQVGGAGVIDQSVNWEGVDDGVNPNITIEYVSTDTAI